MRSSFRCSILSLFLGAMSVGGTAFAQQAPTQGFQLNRYEPTAAGEWSFAVDHPWYSSVRYFAAGLTLDYAHQPLVAGSLNSDGSFSQRRVLIEHQFIGHLDLAGSFLDRVLLTASLPVVFLSQGEPSVSSGASVGDPRLGAMVRLYNQPFQDILSISFGLNLWIPLRAGDPNAVPPSYSDTGVRILPRLVAGGVWRKLLWSGTFGFYYRPEATAMVPADAGDPGGVGSEIQFSLAASYFDQEKRFSVGPELMISGQVLGRDAFSRFGTSVSALVGGQYNIAKLVQVGMAFGTGFVRQAGNPDFRWLLRVAYAPVRAKETDRDGDGIPDGEDACPDVRGIRTGVPSTHGCPPVADRDRDGVPDQDDVCPDEHMGPTPDPLRRGCPQPPESDRDRDGVPDKLDLCPDEHMGPTPDPNRLGCPALDSDKDGYVDTIDKCVFEPSGLHPDPERIGCPLPDRDKDTVPDKVDACPDTPGAPHPNPRKNGCPSLVQIHGGKLVILKPVFFALDKDIILAQSYPVLQAVADALIATPNIKRVRIEGHTDSQGVHIYNIDLSQRRARSVMTWLIAHSIEADRLESQGFGPDQPVAPNTTAAGRAKNRRVEFRIVEGTARTNQGE